MLPSTAANRTAVPHQSPLQTAVQTLSLVLGLILVAWLSDGPIHLGNDDAFMRRIVQGNGGQHPGQPWLLFSHPWLGRLLVGLHTSWSSIPWYNLLHAFAVAVSAATILAVAHHPGTSGWIRLVWLGPVLALWLPFFVVEQFTLTSCICGAAGVVAVASAGLGANWYRSLSWAVLGLFLLTLAFMFRPRGAVLSVGLAVTTALLLGSGQRGSFLRSWRSWLLLGTAVASWYGLHLLDIAAYESADGWGDWYRYNRLRVSLVEYSRSIALTQGDWSAISAAAGWTDNDLSLLRNWLYFDPDLFAIDRLQRAYDALLSRLPAGHTPTRQLHMSTLLSRPALWAALGLLALLTSNRLLLVQCAHRARSWAQTALVPVAFFVALLALQWQFKPVGSHVIWGAAIAAGAGVVAALQVAGASKASAGVGVSPRWDQAVAVLGVVALFAVLAGLGWKSHHTREVRAEVRADMAALAHPNGRLVVAHAAAFGLHHAWPPFASLDSPGVSVVGLGITAQTPLHQSVVQKSGHADVASWICAQPNAVFVASHQARTLVRKYMSQHRQLAIRWNAIPGLRRLQAHRCKVIQQ